MYIDIIKKISTFLLVSTCFVVVFLILYQFENKHFLQNEITPWDGSIFKNLILTLNDKSHEIIQFQFIEPHSSKLLFIVLVNFIKNYFELTIVNAMFWINIVCTYLLFLITFYFLGYFKKKIIIQLILTTCFFLMWNTQLRFSIYMPSYAFAFNTLLITLSTMSIFFLIEKKFYLFLTVIPFVILIAFQRYMVISSIILSSLVFFYLINNAIQNKYLLFIKKFLNFKKAQNLKLVKKRLLLLLIVIFLCVFFLKSISLDGGEFSFLKIIIKFFIFHLHPLEFLYSFYFAYGPLIIILIPNLFIASLRKNLFSYLSKISSIKKIIMVSIFINSILLANLGGDDSHRFLLWFSPWYVLVFYFAILSILKNYKISFILILIPVYIFGARLLVPGIPVYNFNEIFLAKSQYAFTNFDDNLFYGPTFLKKFRKEIEIVKVDITPEYYPEKTKTIRVGVQVGSISNPNIYRQPYRYRINDIPFPLGYIHNQKNALIDHPWHGKVWVRFILIIQWLLIQILYIIILKRNEKK